MARKRPSVANAAPYLGRTLRPDVLSTMQEQSREMPIYDLPGPKGTSAMDANVQRFDVTERDGKPRNVRPDSYFKTARGANFAGTPGPAPYAEGTNTHCSSRREVPLGAHAYINEASTVGPGQIASPGETVRPKTLRQVADSYGANSLSANATRHASAAEKGEVRDGVFAPETLRSTANDPRYAGNAVGAHLKPVGATGLGADGRAVRQTGRESLGDTSYAGNRVGQHPHGPVFGAIELPPLRPDRLHGPGPQARLTGMISSATIGGDTRGKPAGQRTRAGLPTEQKVSYSREGGVLTSGKQGREDTNARFSELGLAKRQLANNPYALNIQDVYG